MKKVILFLFLTASIVAIISCDDQVNPKTDFKDVYALNCVIRGDTSLQVGMRRDVHLEHFLVGYFIFLIWQLSKTFIHRLRLL